LAKLYATAQKAVDSFLPTLHTGENDIKKRLKIPLDEGTTSILDLMGIE